MAEAISLFNAVQFNSSTNYSLQTDHTLQSAEHCLSKTVSTKNKYYHFIQREDLLHHYCFTLY